MATDDRPIFLPEMASWIRPTWFAAWVAMGYGALILLPSLLPRYGKLLPRWTWLGVALQVLSQYRIAAFLDYKKRNGAYGWMVAGIATTGSAVIFTLGLYILIENPLTIWDQLFLTGFGAFCLAFLVGLDRFGFLVEKAAPPHPRNFFDPGGPSIPGSWVMFEVVLGVFVVLVAIFLAMN